MTALIKHDTANVRAKHSRWEQTINQTPAFGHCVTLDPLQAGQVWDRMSAYTPSIEFRELPIRLHDSLILALRSLKLRKL